MAERWNRWPEAYAIVRNSLGIWRVARCGALEVYGRRVDPGSGRYYPGNALGRYHAECDAKLLRKQESWAAGEGR